MFPQFEDQAGSKFEKGKHTKLNESSSERDQILDSRVHNVFSLFSILHNNQFDNAEKPGNFSLGRTIQNLIIKRDPRREINFSLALYKK